MITITMMFVKIMVIKLTITTMRNIDNDVCNDDSRNYVNDYE